MSTSTLSNSLGHRRPPPQAEQPRNHRVSGLQSHPTTTTPRPLRLPIKEGSGAWDTSGGEVRTPFTREDHQPPRDGLIDPATASQKWGLHKCGPCQRSPQVRLSEASTSADLSGLHRYGCQVVRTLSEASTGTAVRGLQDVTAPARTRPYRTGRASRRASTPPPPPHQEKIGTCGCSAGPGCFEPLSRFRLNQP